MVLKQQCKAKVVIMLIKHYAMKMSGGVEVLLHTFLTLALHGAKASASHPSHLLLAKGLSISIMYEAYRTISQCGCCEEENYLFRCPQSNLSSLIIQPVT
jgi:hypothetical protein